MLTLTFGVVEVPYDNREGETVTTVQVATWLEDKYQVMGSYFERHKGDIERSLIGSLEGAIEDLYAGSPIRDPYGDATQGIDAGFRLFLQTAEIESMDIEGVPTQAAIDRRSLRFKSKKSDHARPSFVDTSMYEMSFRSWVTE